MLRFSRLPGMAVSALSLTLASGRHPVCRDRPVSVLANDAATRLPAAAAEVTFCSPHNHPPGELRDQAEAPHTAGQRCSSAGGPWSGEVRVVGLGVLKRINSWDFTAKYADGPLVPRGVKDGEVGLWFLRSKGERYSFLVGTKS